MALTIAAPVGAAPQLQTVYGAAKLVPLFLTGDASYATGGYAVTPAAINTAFGASVSKVHTVIVSACSVGSTKGFASWDATNQKVLFFPATTIASGPFTEAANASDASNFKFHALAVCE